MKTSIILFLLIFLSSCVVINNDNSEISDIKNKLEKQQQTLDNQSEKIEKLENISAWKAENSNSWNIVYKEENNLTKEEIIKEIKHKFGVINTSEDHYMKLSATTYWETSWWSEITWYYNQNNWWHLDKIIEKYYGDMWKWIVEYYFWDKELFFVFSRETYYDKPITFDDFKVESIVDNRYYFNDWQLIEWIKPNDILAEEDDEFKEKNVEYFVQAGEYREFLLEHWIWVD